MGTAPGAARPAVLDVLSAPVFRGGSRRSGILHHQPFEVGRDAAVLRLRLLDQQRFDFCG